MADANCFERDRYAADKEVAANTGSAGWEDFDGGIN